MITASWIVLRRLLGASAVHGTTVLYEHKEKCQKLPMLLHSGPAAALNTILCKAFYSPHSAVISTINV